MGNLLGRIALTTGAIAAFAAVSAAQEPAAKPATVQQQLDQQANEIAELKAALAKIARDDAPTTPAAAAPADGTHAVIRSANSDAENQRIREAQIGQVADDAIVRAGDFADAFAIPGSNFAFRVGGFVRADAWWNFKDGPTGDQWLVPAITPSDPGGAAASIRSSRFNIDVRGDSEYGPVRGFIEMDFLATTPGTNNSFPLRVRHAAVQLGHLHVGQWWSTFADPMAFGETLNLTAPLGVTRRRNPLVAWTQPLCEGLDWTIAVEDPSGVGITDQVTGANVATTRAPEFATALHLRGDWGHARLAGLARVLRAEANGHIDVAAAGGVLATLKLTVPSMHGKDNFFAQFQAGQGIVGYTAGFNRANLDGVYDPVRDRLDPLSGVGGYIGFQKWFNDTIRLNVTFGRYELEKATTLAPTTFRRGNSASLNCIWNPLPQLSIGAEGMWGVREDVMGDSEGAWRFQSSVRFDF